MQAQAFILSGLLRTRSRYAFDRAASAPGTALVCSCSIWPYDADAKGVRIRCLESVIARRTKFSTAPDPYKNKTARENKAHTTQSTESEAKRTNLRDKDPHPAGASQRQSNDRLACKPTQVGLGFARLVLRLVSPPRRTIARATADPWTAALAGRAISVIELAREVPGRDGRVALGTRANARPRSEQPRSRAVRRRIPSGRRRAPQRRLERPRRDLMSS